VTSDLITGSTTVTGGQEIVNLPHSGVVVQDTGRLVVDPEGIVVSSRAGAITAS
jgi:hypothetical protein